MCPACQVWAHPDCWAYNGGCAVYGCSASPGVPDAARAAEAKKKSDSISSNPESSGGEPISVAPCAASAPGERHAAELRGPAVPLAHSARTCAYCVTRYPASVRLLASALCSIACFFFLCAVPYVLLNAHGLLWGSKELHLGAAAFVVPSLLLGWMLGLRPMALMDYLLGKYIVAVTRTISLPVSIVAGITALCVLVDAWSARGSLPEIFWVTAITAAGFMPLLWILADNLERELYQLHGRVAGPEWPRA